MIKVNSKCHSVVRISISFPGALEISLKFNSIFISAITALSRAAFNNSRLVAGSSSFRRQPILPFQNSDEFSFREPSDWSDLDATGIETLAADLTS
ncbi:Uncharacterized protein HZ326_28196 [Fusarium oxysporum f. sp. albedinis]|nr:Uncharacterized protein HZ326_28196 [Fusarium oxysporum f. sp. albedinis]